MSHRLLHSLVFTSVVTLPATGCSLSHARGPNPPEPDDAGTSPDAGVVIGPQDAGPRVRPDAGRPPVPRDAGPVTMADAGPESVDAGDPLFDAGSGFVDAGDARFCDDAWPTTKGMVCSQVDDTWMVCCPSFAPTDCCLVEASRR